CPDKDSPAFEKATTYTCAAYDDEAALKTFADSVDVITYEFENIPTGPLRVIEHKLKPGIDVLATCQHRIKEKQTLHKLGIGTAPFAPVYSQDDLASVTQTIGLPAVLKTATMGYDGKGQWMLKSEGDLPKIKDGEYILEGFVDFSMEISVIVARNEAGDMACYPPVHNTHKHHILHETIYPAPISNALADKAETMARTLADGLQLVGILAVEMFVCGDELLVNELAPRPHNSGHWTMDAATTSQFEQAVRAVCGLKLGDVTPLCHAKMLNIIGEEVNDAEKYIAMPGAKLHLYGKKETRPGRKMGHVTFLKEG
ncbi:MAG: 5-(carboxyamino)imidazole ribonucleotide synthase, partial [Alphaproteobacteria bacterium]